APVFPNDFTSTETKDCKESCCSKSKETQKPTRRSKDCCNSVCNPFMICCNCNALAAQSQGISAPFVYSNQKFNIVSETDKSDFSSDAWNPPKTV
ncbi:MAG: hypothetical protein ACHP9Y_06645, partial [Gammaproteobacteria bacterium]